MLKSDGAGIKTSFLKRALLALAGIFLAAIALEAGLRLGGHVFLSLQNYRNSVSVKKKGDYRILCVGESTTAGQYPSFLEKFLNLRGTGIKFSVIDKGLPGANTTAIISALDRELDEYKPDLVMAMMGCNDRKLMYYKNIPETDSWLFRNFRAYRFGRLMYVNTLHKLGRGKNGGGSDAAGYPVVAVPGNDAARAEAVKDDMNPEDLKSFESAWAFNREKKFAEQELVLKKIIARNPGNSTAYRELGWLLFPFRERYAEAEKALKKSGELNPDGNYAWRLAWLYRSRRKFTEAERVLKKAIADNPYDERLYQNLGLLYRELGDTRLSRAYMKRGEALLELYYDPVMVANYRALASALDKRKIRLVSMQYPMRDIAPLKRLFGGVAGAGSGTIFVDNEYIFKGAVEKDGYDEYFMDMFGGDFGHCTVRGNRLIAWNAANVILKEVFGVEPEAPRAPSPPARKTDSGERKAGG